MTSPFSIETGTMPLSPERPADREIGDGARDAAFPVPASQAIASVRKPIKQPKRAAFNTSGIPRPFTLRILQNHPPRATLKACAAMNASKPDGAIAQT
jgi:hypothetical protein